jgi:hypothetical protein
MFEYSIGEAVLVFDAEQEHIDKAKKGVFGLCLTRVLIAATESAETHLVFEPQRSGLIF